MQTKRDSSRYLLILADAVPFVQTQLKTVYAQVISNVYDGVCNYIEDNPDSTLYMVSRTYFYLLPIIILSI